MSDRPPDEPSGWREPNPRDRWIGPAFVIIVGLLLVGLVVFIVVLTLATYG
jgi:hypothetical protein